MFHRILCTVLTGLSVQFTMHYMISHHSLTLPALLQLPSDQFFSSLYHIAHQKNLSFWISKSFLTDFGQSSVQCLFLKSLSTWKFSSLQPACHGKLLRHEMKKSCVPNVLITNETSRVHDRYFNLDILILTVHLLLKFAIFFFSCYMFAPIFNNSVQIWCQSDQWFFFYCVLKLCIHTRSYTKLNS